MAPPSAGPPRRWASALGGVFFGFVLTVAGGVFVWLLGRAGLRANAMQAWPGIPCTIIESRLVAEAGAPNTPTHHRPVVHYRFEIDGETRESDRIGRVAPKSNQAGKMQALLDRFPAGSGAVCYVDPADPAFSVLVRDRRTPIYSIWFPALFVIGGLGIAFSSVRRNLRQSPTST